MSVKLIFSRLQSQVHSQIDNVSFLIALSDEGEEVKYTEALESDKSPSFEDGKVAAEVSELRIVRNSNGVRINTNQWAEWGYSPK